jgi:hypothetical protein
MPQRRFSVAARSTGRAVRTKEITPVGTRSGQKPDAPNDFKNGDSAIGCCRPQLNK